MKHRSCLVTFLAWAALVGPAAADVLTVDSTPGAGADHADIQSAIDAAADGDVVLVAPGFYTGFQIHGALMQGAELHVIGLGESVVVSGRVSITGVSAEQRVSLVGFELYPPLLSGDPYSIEFEEPGLLVDFCQGTVLLERVSALAPSWPAGGGQCDAHSFTNFGKGPTAARIQSSDDVILQDCAFTGGVGVDDGGQYSPHVDDCINWGSDGGDGLAILSSRVRLHAVVVTGGAGADHFIGGDGGVGLSVSGASEVFASGVSATGGEFGFGYDWPISGWSAGGHGFVAAAGSAVTELGGSYLGGDGVPDGTPLVLSGAHAPLPGGAHLFSTLGPAIEGDVLTLALSGTAGDHPWVWGGAFPVFVEKASLGGALHVAPDFGPFPLAPLTEGLNLRELRVPELGPGVDGVAIHLQAFVLEHDGDKVLTGPALALLLDEGFGG